MSRALKVALSTTRRFPRVSGDEPTLTAVTASPHAFSPREQG